MEVECEMEIPVDKSLATLWIKENNEVIKRWKDLKTRDMQDLKLKLLECDSQLSHLLQKIQGLPSTSKNLPLELTVVYNTLLIHVNITGGFKFEHQDQLRNALYRVLETRILVEASDTAMTDLWMEVLSAEHPQEIYTALARLAGLQAALWLSENKLELVVNLFYLVNKASTMSHTNCNLLEFIKAWEVTHHEEEDIYTLQSASHLKAILYTSAAFLKGLAFMDAADFSQAANLLQEAANSLCTSKILSHIYTCLGLSFYKMGKSQIAIQFWKQALSVNLHCLPALYHTSRLYKDLNRIDSELEALALLHMELENHCEEPSSIETFFLFRTELLLSNSTLSCYVLVPNSWEVKYLIANNYLRRNSPKDAAEHYMDLMTTLLNESQPKSVHPSPAPLPRIPVIYLEAATALLETQRFQDAIIVSEEVLENLSHVASGITSMVEVETFEEAKSHTEKLNYVLWTAAAHFLQGEAHGNLGNSKESITAFTRCINQMTKVIFADSGSVSDNDHTKEHHIFTVLKASAFVGRSQQFLQIGNEKSSTMDVRLALQAMRRFPGALFCFIKMLWKTKHKKEVAIEFRKWMKQSKMKDLLDQYEEIKRDLPLHLVVCAQKSFLQDKSLLSELENYFQKEEIEPAVVQNFSTF